MGRDLSSSSSRSKRKEFQSTRPRGARRARLTALLCSIQSFNPRAHVGRDLIYVRTMAQAPGFNPRAHVGRDDGGSFLGGAYGVSIHAPTWGATPSLRIYGACRPGFNPRAHVGRDSIRYKCFWFRVFYDPLRECNQFFGIIRYCKNYFFVN